MSITPIDTTQIPGAILEVITPPTVNSYIIGSSIEGTFVLPSTFTIEDFVTITLFIDGIQLAELEILSSNKKFSYKPTTPLKVDSIITATLTVRVPSVNNITKLRTSTYSTPVTIKDGSPNPPTINVVYENDRIITGSIQTSGQIIVYLNGKEIKRSSVVSPLYSISINNTLKFNDSIEVQLAVLFNNTISKVTTRTTTLVQQRPLNEDSFGARDSIDLTDTVGKLI